MDLGKSRTGQHVVVAIPSAILLACVVAAAVLALPRATPVGPFQSAQLGTAHIPGPCDGGARKAFTPTTVDIQGVGEGLSVIALPRDYADVPGVPPVSATHTVAFDAPGPHPGDSSGLVRLNAHTWPNGAALGNELLAKFDVGDILTLRDGDKKLCYRVTERVEVSAYSTYERFFELDGKPEFALIVCSGQRLGPGNWSERTVWWGKPV
ncbi:MAG: class F sortase [Aeromicrobium sp.]